MNAMIFIILSILEWTALLTLSFSMFLFQFRGYIAHIIFTSAILSSVSYLLYRVFDLAIVAPIIQLAIVFFFFWLMFRIHIFYAAIVTTYGYIGYLMVQLLIFLVPQWLNISSINETLSNEAMMNGLQILSVIVCYIISAILIRYRIGFSFISDNEQEVITLKRENIYFLILIILSAITIALFYISATYGYSQVTFMLLSTVLGVLLYYALNKERKQ